MYIMHWYDAVILVLNGIRAVQYKMNCKLSSLQSPQCTFTVYQHLPDEVLHFPFPHVQLPGAVGEFSHFCCCSTDRLQFTSIYTFLTMRVIATSGPWGAFLLNMMQTVISWIIHKSDTPDMITWRD